MAHFNKKLIISLLILFALFAFVTVNHSVAQEQISSLSGHLTNPSDEPIPDVSVVLLYVKIGGNLLYNSRFYPFLHPIVNKNEKIPDEDELQERPPYLQCKTDSEGRFSFTDIPTGLVQLMVLPEIPIGKRMKDQETGTGKYAELPFIQSIQFGEVSFYPHQFPFYPPTGAVTFAIEPGINIDDVELKVIMENPLKIRCRIVFENDEPLSDTELQMDVGKITFDGINGFRKQSLVQTDEDGIFDFTVYEQGLYALSVKHIGQFAITNPFRFDGKQQNPLLILKLSGDADLPSESKNTENPYQMNLPQVPEVWILNPTNGHIYKRIECTSRADAQLRASRDDAYLVTITNEAEQIWLEAAFGKSAYWIGLSDMKNEGDWQWDNGEPFNYTNWKEGDESIRNVPALLRFFGVKDDFQVKQHAKKDFAVMSDDGWNQGVVKWIAVASEKSHIGWIQMAILEKNISTVH